MWSHVIAVDMPVDDNWPFAQDLSREAGIPFHVVARDGRAHVKRWQRILIYVMMGFKLFVHRRQMCVLVCWQQFFGLMFAWLCSIFHVKKNTRLTVMTFIFRPKRGLIGRLYQHWVTTVLNSGYVDHVTVFSHHEVDYYSKQLGVNKSLFTFVPLAIDELPQLETTDGGFLFSTGKSNRDYDFLISALSGTSHHLVIACDELKQPLASNIVVYRHTFNQDMLALMARASAVVIALDNAHVSSGQLVVLQAMALGKPVIVTRSSALDDYVVPDKTGFMVDKTARAFLLAVNQIMGDPALRQRMGEAARQRFSSRHKLSQLAHHVLTTTLQPN